MNTEQLVEQVAAALDVVDAVRQLFYIMDRGPMQQMMKSTPFGVVRDALARYDAVVVGPQRPDDREVT